MSMSADKDNDLFYVTTPGEGEGYETLHISCAVDTNRAGNKGILCNPRAKSTFIRASEHAIREFEVCEDCSNVLSNLDELGATG